MVEPEKNVSSSSAQTTSQGRSETSRQFRGPSSFEGGGQGASALEGARQWVQQNQLMATLGAFALGAFIGAMMRD